MKVFLFLIPVLVLISSVFIYRFNGQKEILRFDLVQFIYGFLIVPLLFIWLKSFLFFLLRPELSQSLSVSQLFVIDTSFSVIFLFFFAFAIINFLTTSFKYQKLRDPFYDLFEHSEYFHLWLSHLVGYFGAMIIMTFVAIVNILAPTTVEINQIFLYLTLPLSLVLSLFIFIIIYLSDPQQGHFMRLMKLQFALFFSIHVLVYLIFEPSFSLNYVLYWISLMTFANLVFLSIFAERNEKITNFFDKFKYQSNWGNNIKLFKK